MEEGKEGEFSKNPEGEMKTGSSKRLFIILGIIILLIIVAVIVCIIIFSGNKNSSSSSSSQTYEYKIDQTSISYKAANIINKDTTINEGEYTSSNMDENVFLVVDGATLTLGPGVKITKTGEKSTRRRLRVLAEEEPPEKPDGGEGGGDKPPSGGGDDSYSFYGINSAIVVLGSGSKAILNGISITTNSYGANAIVAVDQGSVNIKNSTIRTTKDSSRGLHATYKGSITAENVNIGTKGGSCANLATDRGEGTVTATNVTLSTEGAGSPLIYSTGDITVKDSTGYSAGAQICVVEGKNSASLKNCKFSCSGKGNRGTTDVAGVMVYQSMSMDADVGTGHFEATDSELIVSESDIQSIVPMFFVTNTDATIDLVSTKTEFSSSMFLNVNGTSEWGNEGENGGNVVITIKGKTISGQIYADDISSVKIKIDGTNVKEEDFTTSGNVEVEELEE